MQEILKRETKFLNLTEEEILSSRDGKILSTHTILKFDNFVRIESENETEQIEQPSKQVTRLEGVENQSHFYRETKKLQKILQRAKDAKLAHRIAGACNFRRAKYDNFFIYGISQPPVHSIRAVLNLLKGKHVVWINLREEPVIYINRRPFVLREHDHIYHNVNYYRGIDATRLESMENRLKMEILKEAEKYNGNIIIHDETYQNDVLPCWESISEASTQTAREVFEEMSKLGYTISYHRVPITPEHRFEFPDYDEILNCIKDVNEEITSLVFNCQLGKGRSATAMVISCLYFMWKNKKDREFLEMQEPSYSDDLKAQFYRGEYKLVLSLLRLLKNGNECKKQVDTAIDFCSDVVHLRESIYHFKTKAEKARYPEDQKMWVNKAFRNLERYYYLIAFNAYLGENFSKNENERITFDEWMKQRPEIVKIIERAKSKPFDALDGYVDEYQKMSDIDVVFGRNGNVLGKASILKMDQFFDTLDHFEHFVKGVPNFRKVDADLNIFAAGSPSKNGVVRVLKQLNSVHKKILWVNLREEPVIYINGKSYVLRDIAHPFQNIAMTGIDGERLENIEDTLKADAINELRSGNSRILLHDETESAELISFWEPTTVKQIYTIKQLFDELKTEGFKLEYQRIPMALGSGTFKFVDNILNLLRQMDDDAAIIVNSHSGLGRSTTAMIFIYLYKRSISGDKSSQTYSSTSIDPTIAEYNAVRILLRYLPNGLLNKYLVDKAIDVCKTGVNELDVRKEIELKLKQLETARHEMNVATYIEKAVSALSKYVLFITFAGYLSDQIPKKFECDFTSWINKRPEILSVFDDIQKQPMEALKKRVLMDKAELSISEGLRWVYSRNGSVLGKGTFIKADHFYGCQRKHLRPKIDGAPNFRNIHKFNVYGVAIPTLGGVSNVLDYLDAKNVETVWINLREEPVIYVNGRPFVLRDIDNPLANIEQTGIEYDRVEEMEIRLKEDLLEEAKQNNGRVLLHDEKEDYSLYCTWETVTNDTIQTPRELYRMMKEQGYKVHYYRIPITDEQAPEEKDFDDLINKCKDKDPTKTNFVFNCQMGRGRTTTGLIIACLLNSWKKPKDWISKIQQVSKSESTNSPAQNYRNGNYKLILKLLRVLDHAEANKTQVDNIIDLCSAMQNLRTAIYDYKVKSESDSIPEKQRKEALKIGLSYLKRYFLLIVFNEYLYIQMKKKEELKDAFVWQSYADWLRERSEIMTLLETPYTLD